MKTALVLIAMMAASVSFASNGLDGRSYCRTIVSDGFMRQPVGESHHCISFHHGLATDNANTHFGNPPETMPYTMFASGEATMIVFGDSKYILAEDGSTITTVRGSAVEGTILSLQD